VFFSSGGGPVVPVSNSADCMLMVLDGDMDVIQPDDGISWVTWMEVSNKLTTRGMQRNVSYLIRDLRPGPLPALVLLDG